MKKKSPSKIEVFSNIAPGMSASYSVGSDSYGYWISKVDYENGIIACYSPNAKYTIGWQDGELTAEPFDPTHVADIQLKYRYGCWYEYHRPTDSWNRTYFKNLHISKDSPRIYRDPSF